MPVPVETHLALATVASQELRAWSRRRDDALRKAFKAGATRNDMSRAVGMTLTDLAALIRSFEP